MPNLLVSRRNGDLVISVELKRRRKVTVGRSGRCDLHLDAPAISRRHALLIQHGTEWLALDTASTTGLHVPGQSDAAGERVVCAALSAESWVRLGPAYLWLDRPPGSAPAAPASHAEAGELPPLLRVYDLEGRPRRVVPLSGVEAVTVGRDDACDIVLADAALSRLHTIIYLEGQRWCVADADSSSGTLVEGKRARRRRLADHMIMRIGAHLLQVQGCMLGRGDDISAPISAFIDALDEEPAGAIRPSP